MSGPWVWERTEEELEALYQIAVARSARWTRAAFLLAAPIGLPVLLLVTTPVRDAVAWSVAGGMAVASALWVLRHTGVRRRARLLRRHLERRDLGLDRVITVAREPWGLEIRSDDGFVRVGWGSLAVARRRGRWAVEHGGKPLIYLPDRPPVPALLAPPDEPAPMPPDLEGTVAWTFGYPEQAAWSGANGVAGWRVAVALSVAVLATIALGGLGMVALGGRVGVAFAVVAGLLLLWRLVAHLRYLWASRPVPIGTRCTVHVGPEGVRSGAPDMQVFSPWVRLRVWKEHGDYVFVGRTVGAWHMIPRAALPDEGPAWFRAGQEARRSDGAEAVAPAARANPFEPPVR